MMSSVKNSGSPETRVADKVDVVIVTYNGKHVLKDCLNSLKKAESENLVLSVTVVDNASTDGTAVWLRELYPDVRVIDAGYNAGFSVANNLALRRASSEFILILNPDTILTPETLPHLLTLVKEDPKIGMVGCRLQQLDGSFDHAAKRGFPSSKDALKYFLRKPGTAKRSRYLAEDVDEYGVGEVDAVNGAFMLVRNAAVREVGLFDESYWMYGEDLDWCRRFKLSGWKVYYDGRVTSIHVKSGITGKLRSPKLNWHFHKSMAIFYKKYEGGSNFLVDGTVFVGILLRMVYLTLKYFVSKIRFARNEI